MTRLEHRPSDTEPVNDTNNEFINDTYIGAWKASVLPTTKQFKS
jgi:hypothetical protein